MTVNGGALLRLSLPSPAQGVWHVGPLPLRAYALCILTGVVVSVTWSNRRWVRRGGRPGAITDIAMWAVPAGLVGARIYHVLTDPELYFTRGRNPWDAFAVWQRGLGIWGGVAGGVLGAWYACRRYHLRLADVVWTVAPALPVAQAIGRLGNWLNQELYGSPSSLPWAVAIDPAHRPPGSPSAGTYQPTFLYELVWDLRSPRWSRGRSGGSGCPGGRRSPSTPPRGPGSKRCGWTTPTASLGWESTTGPPWWCSSPRSPSSPGYATSHHPAPSAPTGPPRRPAVRGARR